MQTQMLTQMLDKAALTRSGCLIGLDPAKAMESLRARATPIAVLLAIFAAVTIILRVAGPLLDLDHAAFGYLIPVIIAATRWGIGLAVFSGLAGLAASAYFFYPPIYDLHITKPAHVADLVLFVVVAIVTGQLANQVRSHVQAARRSEEEMKALYFFSRRLAVASGPADIEAAIEHHLSAITGCRIVLYAAGARQARPETSPQWRDTPEPVRQAILAILDHGAADPEAPLFDKDTGASWLIRILAQRTSRVGILAIELGQPTEQDKETIRRHINAAVAEAGATLERINVAHAISEAKVRSEAETLRAALIGSVSHELRTPLASILGSASVLAQAPSIARDARLSSLVDIIHSETGRLNNDIQNLLDASRISGPGVHAHLTWAEPPDVVNAALSRLRQRLMGHQVVLRMAEDLPLMRIDPVLVEQALSQVIDNAAKYSPVGSTITVTAASTGGVVEITVRDEGAGLTTEERARLFERFYRGVRHGSEIKGSGLGLWIARAFVRVSGGELEATSAGAGCGTTITMTLPAPQPGQADSAEADDE